MLDALPMAKTGLNRHMVWEQKLANELFVADIWRADAERFQLHALVPRQAQQGRVHLRLRAFQRR